jgi:hypothetical protein
VTGRRLFVAGLAFALASVTVTAQWVNFKTPGVPRTADGKPKLHAPAPHALDGHPDLSGTWMHELTSVAEVRRLFGPRIDEEIKVDVPGMEIGTQHKYLFNILADVKPQDSPLRPETVKLLEQRAREAAAAPLCNTGAPPGFPIAGLLSEPIKVVQAPRLTMIVYEVGNAYRQIYTDGRKLPAEINLPSYYGYSVGRWERDTFVVETAGFNGKTPLDAMGHPRSDQMHIVERFRRRDFGHLDVEMTFDDPKFYTRPFTVHIPHDLIADGDVFESFPENEKDCERISAKK